MRFVLEESSWCEGASERLAYIERIEQLLDRLDVARDRGEVFACSGDLLLQQVLPELPLTELLWGADSPLRLPREVRERIDAHFGMMRNWEELEASDGKFEAMICGKLVNSLSAAFAHSRVRRGQALACLPLPGRYLGPCSVVVDGVDAPVHFVVNANSHRAFFRDALNVERADEAGLEMLAPHAFPDIWFIDGVWDGLRHFEGGYRRVRDELHHFLGVLDDHGHWIFSDTTGRLSPKEPSPPDGSAPKGVTNGLIEKRFHGFGLIVTPENAEVYEKERYRKPRERMLGNRLLYCEWHYKIDPHTNRVHIHAPIPESGDKVIVAIFRQHLVLPGDN